MGPQGPVRLQGFARGGIVTGPTMFIAGEGGRNEAIVPLSDGRFIPVKGGGARVNVTVINNHGGAEVETKQKTNGNGDVDLTIQIEKVIAKSARIGQVGRAIEQTFGVRRNIGTR